MHPAVKDFLCDLLKARVVRYNWKQDEGQSLTYPFEQQANAGSFMLPTSLLDRAQAGW